MVNADVPDTAEPLVRTYRNARRFCTGGHPGKVRGRQRLFDEVQTGILCTGGERDCVSEGESSVGIRGNPDARSHGGSDRMAPCQVGRHAVDPDLDLERPNTTLQETLYLRFVPIRRNKCQDRRTVANATPQDLVEGRAGAPPDKIQDGHFDCASCSRTPGNRRRDKAVHVVGGGDLQPG